MKRSGFTFVEIAVGVGVSMLVLVLIAGGVGWLRHSISLMLRLEEDAALLLLPRFCYQELEQAQNILVPNLPPEEESTVSSQVIYVDRFGDVQALFLEPGGRLVQYSMQRQQFRDVCLRVLSLRAERRHDGTLMISIERFGSDREKEILHAQFAASAP